MAQNQMYRIAEINIPGAEDSLKSAGLQESLSSYISGIGPTVILKKDNGSNRIGIYISQQHIDSQLKPILDPLVAKLEEFKNEHSGNWTSVELTFYDVRSIMIQNIRDDEVRNLRESLRRLQVEAGNSQGTIESLETQLNIVKGRYERVVPDVDVLKEQLRATEIESGTAKQYGSELEKQVASLKRDALQVSTTPESLVDMLRGNEQLYSRAQENMITEAYNQVSSDIDKREFYEKMEEVIEARKTIERRGIYLAKYGEAGLEDLPQSGKDSTLKEWNDAEQIVADYDKYQAGIPTLNVPVRIAKTEGGAAIVIPVNPKSDNEVTRSLYDNLVAYSAELQSEFGIEASVDDKQPFATLNITGEVDDKTIEDKLLSTFGDVAEQAKLNLQPFPTSYFISAPEIESSVLGKVNPGDYIKERITELGYPSLQRFSDEKSIKGVRSLLYKLSHGAGLSRQSIDTLSTALEIDSSKLEGVIKNYQSSLSENGSAPPEIESSVPAEVIAAPSEVIAAPKRVNPGADYLISLVREKYGNQKKFHAETGIQMAYFLGRLRDGHEIPDNSIKKIKKHFPGVRWDTIKRNIRK